MNKLQAFFCLTYNKWLSKAVDSKDDILVRIIDALAGSNCKYCMAVRMFLLGVAVFASFWVMLPLVFVAWFFTWGEKRWVCRVKAQIRITYPIAEANKTAVLTYREGTFVTVDEAETWAKKEMGDVPYTLEIIPQ